LKFHISPREINYERLFLINSVSLLLITSLYVHLLLFSATTAISLDVHDIYLTPVD